MKDLQRHWDNIYLNNTLHKLGWYEEDLSPTLGLINKTGIGPNSRILNVGAGSTTLIDYLLLHGYKNLLANDISKVALTSLRNRIGNSDKVEWIVDDLLNSTHLKDIEPVDLWIDRAVLHFFTEDQDQLTYFTLMKNLVHKYGYVILAQFSMLSAERCSGLPLHRYNIDQLNDRMEPEFRLVTKFDHIYTMPTGDPRPYIYTLYKRIS